MILISPVLANAAENDDAPRTAALNPPSMELIEFLGDFETEQGEWLDPMDLDIAALPDGEHDNEKTTD